MIAWSTASFWREMALLGAIVAAAGTLRGFSGFGAALLMAPAFALVIGPRQAVPLIMLLNTLSITQLLLPAWRLTRWDVVLPLTISAGLTFPLGLVLLLALDPHVAKHVIAAVVIVIAALLLAGVRLADAYDLPRSVAVGAASGVITGLSSISGPLVVPYLFAGRHSAATARASVITFFAITQVLALPPLVVMSVMTQQTLVMTVVLLPVFLASTAIGVRLFALAPDRAFKRLAALLLLGLGIVTLVAS